MNDAAEIHNLKKRITYLESLLTVHNISFDTPDVPSPQSAPVPVSVVITPAHARFFFSLFHGRSDVYAKRAVMKSGKAGYFPVCVNLWQYGVCPKADRQKVKCVSCPNRSWAPLSQRVLMAHLAGKKTDSSDVIGIYPLLPDDTCRFLVFDFDDHEASPGTAWQEDVDALRKICSQNAVPCYVERSRSGSGAHAWLFFDAPIPAELARRFGSALLTKGAESVNLKDFKTYDRMLPAQEHLPEGGLGNLIALPLQGQALRQSNSAFVDENWNAYPNQWEYIKSVQKIGKAFVEEKAALWGAGGSLGTLSKTEDVAACLQAGRTPLVLTKEKDHAAFLYEHIKPNADHVFLLQGGSNAKQKEELRTRMRSVPPTESVVLVAIGQCIGEGFNFPRLDTMMLTMPISWQGNVEQYAGRLHRDYAGKQDVIIYDYVDAHIRVLESMYYKRLRTYKRIGYEIIASTIEEKQSVNAIFDSESYLPVYEKDLQQACKSIYIASPGLNKNKVSRLIALVEERQTAGVCVTVITLPVENYPLARIEPTKALQSTLTAAGIYCPGQTCTRILQ